MRAHVCARAREREVRATQKGVSVGGRGEKKRNKCMTSKFVLTLVVVMNSLVCLQSSTKPGLRTYTYMYEPCSTLYFEPTMLLS